MMREVIDKYTYEDFISIENDSNGEINLILETFLDVIKENNRLDSNLDYEDVKVLCILYNVIFLKKDRHRYVERINSWRI